MMVRNLAFLLLETPLDAAETSEGADSEQCERSIARNYDNATTLSTLWPPSSLDSKAGLEHPFSRSARADGTA